MQISRPNRIARSYVQKLVAPPAQVFPLLCPVREADWIEGWDPIAVFSNSGVAELDCVFVTRAEPHHAVWMITRHDPGAAFLEMIKITPEVVATKLTIHLRPRGAGCDAQVTYAHTSLGPAGDEFLKGFSEEAYVAAMRAWENRLNHYLTHGERLREV